MHDSSSYIAYHLSYHYSILNAATIWINYGLHILNCSIPRQSVSDIL
jgi:hypothetical protein